MTTTLQVSVERRGAVRGAALVHEGEVTPEAIGLARGRLLVRLGASPAHQPPFGLLHEGSYEACWPLAPGTAAPEGFREAEAPEGWYAVAIHEGGYDGLCETLARIEREWLPHGGFKRREGPVVHRYLNDPRACAEGELRTEVCLPVDPAPVE